MKSQLNKKGFNLWQSEGNNLRILFLWNGTFHCQLKTMEISWFISLYLLFDDLG